MAHEPNIPNLDGLVALANRDGVDIKPTLLRVTTDLYVQKPSHSAEEERHYTELALRLIDAVDGATRAVVKSKLLAYAAPPRPVMQRLEREQTTSTSGDPGPLPQARNATAASELSELFLAASPAERRLILLNLDVAALPPAQSIPLATARPSIARLERAALDHNTAAFAQELESTLAIPRTLAHRLIEDETGEPLAVVARVLAMPPDVLQRILLCLNPAISRSVQRVYEIATLYDHIELLAALRLIAIWRASQAAPQKVAMPRAPAASPMVPIPPRPAAHQPHYWHVEERKPATLPARPKIRWDEHAEPQRAERKSS
jgi:hypothetical protein